MTQPVYNSIGCDKFMANPKKIVIKINRSGGRQKDGSASSAPSEIVIWNVRRIVIALIVAVLFIVIPYFLLDDGLEDKNNNKKEFTEASSNEDKSSSPEKVAVPDSVKSRRDRSIKSDIKPTDPSIKPFKTIEHYKIRRGLLTHAISSKEPIDELAPPFKVSENGSFQLYYFTEIRDMKGHSLFHQWIKDGVVVQKTAIKPQGNRWRVSSNRDLTHTDIGRWIVQLLDQDGLIYHEMVFEVEGD